MNRAVALFAERLDDREYGNEISKEEVQIAKEQGIVIVFGYSDDCVEFEGAIRDEVGCYDKRDIFLTPDGLLKQPDCTGSQAEEVCPYYVAAKEAAKVIHASFGKTGWEFETDIPHASFAVYEDGEQYGQGLVFALQDV